MHERICVCNIKMHERIVLWMRAYACAITSLNQEVGMSRSFGVSPKGWGRVRAKKNPAEARLNKALECA